MPPKLSSMSPTAPGDPTYLGGQLLVAMPQMKGQPFQRSVIYLCAHSAEGAMGIVVNKLVSSLSFPQLLAQLEIESAKAAEDRRVHFGGPVETTRGFVLHSTDLLEENSLLVDEEVALTSTVDILRAIAEGDGPRQSLLALGYAGWGPGQLESEMQANAWLTVEPDDSLLFDQDLETKWARAINKLGVDINMLSGEIGHA